MSLKYISFQKRTQESGYKLGIYACVGILQNSLQWQNTSKSSAAPQVTSVSLQISAANLHTVTSSKQGSFENFSFIHADAAIATAFVSCIVVVLVVVVDVFCVNVIDAEIITCNAPDVAVVIIVLDDVVVGFVVNIYVIIVSSVWVGLIVPIVISTAVVVDTLIIKKLVLVLVFTEI